jgi:type IV pilus assembly protein PilA
MWRCVKGTKGFTLIELMIVVAIIGILAAIAIPNFVAMQLRSKRSELPTNVDAIRTAEWAYAHEWDIFTSCSARPVVMPVKEAVAFEQTQGDGSDWDLLGWLPDGLVRAQYSAVLGEPIIGADLDEEGSVAGEVADNLAYTFTATAIADIDGDEQLSEYRATEKVKPDMISPNSYY